MRAVKSGVKTRNLRRLRQPFAHGADGCEVVRLVQGRKWNQTFEFRMNGFIDQYWPCVLCAAVHHAVTNRDHWLCRESGRAATRRRGVARRGYRSH